MKTSKKVGIVCSILIHILPLLFLIDFLVKKNDPPPPPQEEKSIEVRLIPLKNEEVTTTEPQDVNIKSISTPEETICAPTDKTYEGIGFKFNPGSGIIDEVPESYPAYKAGVRVGDFLITQYMLPRNGYMDFTVVRNSKEIKFHVKTQKICYKDN